MSPASSDLSPYVVALGDRRAELHPRLQTYFSSIPAGSTGIGEGVFDRIGTRRRWLRPLLRPLQRRGVLFAGWATAVPFRIRNRTVGGRAVGERDLLLAGGGVWTMRDAVSLNRHGHPLDLVGEPALVAASFDVDVSDGALRMTSRAIGVRLGPLRIRVPRPFAPVVRLTEGYDEDAGRQRVLVTIDAPLLGRVYEYSGTFAYRIQEDA